MRMMKNMDFVTPNKAPEYTAPAETTKRNKVVNIAATTQLSVVLVKPERFEDASGIADHLNAKRTVVLNLESTNKEVSRRLIDFLAASPTPTKARSNGSLTAPTSSPLTMWILWAICWMSWRAAACFSKPCRKTT